MELKDKIKRLTNAYGVSGDEFRVSEIAAELLRPYVDSVEIDRFGNVTGKKSCGIPGAKKLLLDAHIDQIGFMITGVTDDGFLRFVGMGVDQRMLPGSEMVVLTADGPIPGIVAALPPHLQKEGDNEKSIAIEDMFVDIGMTGEEAKKRVRVGDYMVFHGETFDLLGDALCGRCLDDRACFCCILYALEQLEGKQLPVDLIICASTKEERGGHGAQAVSYREFPDYAVAVDVCHARTDDAPEVQSRLGDGPVITIGSNSRPHFARLAREVALAKEIPFVLNAAPAATGTNAWTMQMMREGICTLVISLPLKYMHSPVEVLRMSDVRNVGRLLAELAQAMGRL